MPQGVEHDTHTLELLEFGKDGYFSDAARR
jgi:hypothetical protein